MSAHAELRRRTPGKRSGLRGALLSGCAIAAVAATAPAHGQAFNGTVSQALGASRATTGTGTETITVNAGNALVKWTATDNNFLPSGNTATFEAGYGISAFTILNEVTPIGGAAISLNGAINSTIGGTTGGNVWFSAPGGIIVGGTARFNIGGMVLSANAIIHAEDGYGTQLFNGGTATAGTIQFRGADGSTSEVRVDPITGTGTQINANDGSGSSYLALVAPRVTQNGTVTVNGSAGYLALTSADVTINAGLFDISASNLGGSQVATGGETTLTHKGSTTVTNPTGPASPHNIYMVAIPKNDAVTMLVSGTVGYQSATTATVANGKIILDAGYVPRTGADVYQPSLIASNISIDTQNAGAGIFRAPVFANATSSIAISANGANLTFSNGLSAKVFNDSSLASTISLSSSAAHTLDVGQFVDSGGSAVTLASGNAGAITIAASGGSTLNVRHDLSANSIGTTFVATDGGTTAFNVTGATTQATVGGALTLDSGTLGTSVAASAGSSTIDVQNGSLTVAGLTSVYANGLGNSAAAVGTGVGGTARVQVSAGGKASFADLAVSAIGTGYSGSAGFGNVDGTGGTAAIDVDGGGISTTGTVTITANGAGGVYSDPSYGGAIGSGSGGTARMTVANSTSALFANIAGSLAISANGSGGDPTTAPGLAVAGGNGFGGGIATGTNGAILQAGAAGVITVAGATTVSATGTGMNGNNSFDGGTGTGGTVDIATNPSGGAAASITLAGLTARATGTGGTVETGYGASGGVGIGGGGDGSGSAGVSVRALGGTISVTNASISANGIGGDGDASGNGGTGANGTGGAVSLTARGGSVTGTSIALSALGFGGGATGLSFPGAAGVGAGGTITAITDLSGSTNGAITLTAALTAIADGIGGTGVCISCDPLSPPSSLGGSAGGFTTVTASAGTIQAASLTVTGNGGSGNAGLVADGGAITTGTGAVSVTANGGSGTAYVQATGGSIATGNIAVSATGGSGSALIEANGAPISAGNVTVSADGAGGLAQALASNAGSASVGALTVSANGPATSADTGGNALISLDGGGLTATGAVIVRAQGTNSGANDYGGTAKVVVANSSATLFGDFRSTLSIDASSGSAGAGFGGTAGLQAGSAGRIGVVGMTTVAADGTGNAGFDSVFLGGDIHVDAGNGVGGTVDIATNPGGGTAGTISLGTLIATATGRGGDGEAGYGANGGAGIGGGATGSNSSGVMLRALGGGTINIVDGSLFAQANGGAGGSGTDGSAGSPGTNGGAGGSATAGQAIAIASGGGRIGTLATPTSAQSLSLYANAFAGAGGAGGVTETGYGIGGNGGSGGAATAGSTSFTANTGGIVQLSQTGLYSDSFAGAAGTGGSGDTAGNAGAEGGSVGGQVSLGVADAASTATLGNTTLIASGFSSAISALDPTGAAGAITISATGPATGALSFAALAATAQGVVAGVDPTFNFIASGQPVVVTDATSITVTGNAAFALSNAAALSSGGNFAVTATGNIVETSSSSAVGLLAARRIDLVSTGGSITTGAVTSTLADLNITAAGNVDTGALTAGDSVKVRADGGTASVASAVVGNNTAATSFAGAIAIFAQSGVTLGTGTAYGSIGLYSQVGGISSTQLSAGNRTDGTTSADLVVALADGTISLDSVTAPGQIFIGGTASTTPVDSSPTLTELILGLHATPSPTGSTVTIGTADGGSAQVNAGSTLSLASLTTRTGSATLLSGADITGAASVTSAGALTITAAGSASLAGISAGGDLTASAGTTFTSGNIASSGGAVLVQTSDGAIVAGTVDALTDATILAVSRVNPGDLEVGDVTAGRDVIIDTVSNGTPATGVSRTLTVGNVTAGDDIILRSFGATTGGSLTTTGLGTDGTTPTAPFTFTDLAGSSIESSSGTSMVLTAVAAPGNVQLGVVPFSSGGTVLYPGTGPIDVGAASVGGSLVAFSQAGPVALRGVAATGGVTAVGTGVSVAGSGDLHVVNANATGANGDLALSAVGSLQIDAADAVRDLTATAGGMLTTPSLNVGRAISLTGNTGVATQDLTAPGAISITSSGGSVGGGAIDGGSVTVNANGAVTLTGAMFARTGAVSLTSGGAASIADLTADGDATLAVGGALSGGNVDVGGTLSGRTADGGITLGGITAVTDVALATHSPSGAGRISVGSVTAGRDIGIDTFIVFGDATSGDRTTTTGNLTAGDDILLGGIGALRAGTLRTTGLGQDGTSPAAGTDTFGNVAGSAISSGSRTSVTYDAVDSAGTVFIQVIPFVDPTGTLVYGAGLGPIDVGAITASGVVTALNQLGTVSLRGIAAPAGVNATGTAVTLDGIGDLHVINANATAGDLDVSAVGSLLIDAADASNDLTADAGGTLTVPTLDVGGAITLTGDAGVTAQNLTALNAIAVSSSAGGVGAGAIDGGTVQISANAAVSTAAIQARTGDASIIGTNAPLTLGNVSAARDLLLTANSLGVVTGASSTGTLTAGRDVAGLFLAATSVRTGTVSAGRDAFLYAPVLLASAGGVPADANLTTGDVIAGDDVLLSANGTIMSGALTSTGLGQDGTSPFPGAPTDDGRFVAVVSGHGMSLGSLSAMDGIYLSNSTTPFAGAQNTAAADGLGAIQITGASTAGTLTATNTLGTINLQGIAATGGVTATGTAVTLAGSGDLHVVDADATAGDLVISTPGTLLVDAATTSGAITASSGGGSATFNTLDVGTASLSAGTVLTLTGDLTTRTGDAILHAGTNLQAQDATIFGSLMATAADGTAAFGAVTAGTDIGIAATTLTGPSTIITGNLTAGRDVEVLTHSSSSISTARNITVADVQAGDDITLSTFGAVAAGALTATGAGTDGTAVAGDPYGNRAGASVYIISEEGTVVRSIAATGSVEFVNIAEPPTSDGLGAITVTDSLTAGTTVVAFNGLGAVDLANITAPGGVTATGTSVTLAGTGDLHVLNGSATAGDLDLSAPGNILLDAGGATGSVTVDAGGTLTVPTLDAGGAISLAGNAGITAQDLTAVGAIALTSSGGGVGAGAIDGGSVQISANRALALSGDLTTRAGDATLRAGGGLTGRNFDVAGSLAETADSIAIGDVAATGSMTLLSAGAIGVGAAQLGGDAIVLQGDDFFPAGNGASNGGISAGAILAGGDIRLISTEGRTSAGNLSAGRDVTAAGYGGLSAGDISGGRDVVAAGGASAKNRFDPASGTTTVTAGSGPVDLAIGNATAGDDVYVMSTGTVTAGTLRSTGLGEDGTNSGGVVGFYPEGGSRVDVRSAAGARIDTVDAAGAVTLENGTRTVFDETEASESGLPALAITDVQLAPGSGDIVVAQSTSGSTVTATNFGAIDLAGITAPGGVTATGTAVTLAGASDLHVVNAQATAGDLALTAAGDLLVDTADASGNLAATAGGLLTVPALDVGGAILLSGATGIAAQDIHAGTGVALTTATGTIQAGTISTDSGDITLAALANSLALGDITNLNGGIGILGANGVTAGTLLAGDTIMVASSDGGVALTGAATSTGGGIMVQAAGAVSTQTVQAARSISLSSTGGALAAAGDITSSGGTARLGAGGAIDVANVTAAGSVFLTGGAAIRSGNLAAGVGTLLAGEASGVGATPTSGGIAAGFDGTTLTPCDDCFTGAVDLPFSVNYFGTTYAVSYVSNNGYLTFNRGQGNYSPEGLGATYSGQPIIAAYFADVDTRGIGATTYGSGTYAGHAAFGATYNNVGYFSNGTNLTNTFQIVLTDRSDTGAGNFDIYYNYAHVGWDRGTGASVGYNAGIRGNPDGTFFELPGSRVVGAFVDGGTMPLIQGTNDGVPGQFAFAVRNGQIVTASEPPTVHVTNTVAGNTAAIAVGDVSGEAVDIRGAGDVTVGTVTVGDHGSGIAAPGLAFATAIQATGNLVTGDVNGSGIVLLGSDTADVSAGSITSGTSVGVLANGNVVLGQVTTGRGIDALLIGGPGTLGETSLTDFVTSTDSAALPGFTPTSVGGAITVTGPVATGTLTAAALGAVRFATVEAGDRIVVAGDGGITTQGLTATNGIRLTSAAGGITTADLASASGRVQVDNAFDDNGAAIGLGSISGGAVDIHGAGAVTVNDVTVREGGGTDPTTVIQAAGPLMAGAIDGPGTVALASDTGTVGATSITTQGDAVVLAGGGIALGPVTTGAGSTVLVGGAGSLGDATLADFVDGGDRSDIANAALTQAGGPIQFNGVVSTGTLIASALGDITLGTATATDLLSLDTAGTAILSGRIGGPLLRVSSTNVMIDTSATTEIGDDSTQEIAFTNTGALRTQVGGDDATDAWSVSNAEFGRLAAHTISFDAPNVQGSGADLTIGKLDVIGSAGTATDTRRRNLTGSELVFDSAGSVLVNGAVSLTGAGAEDTISIFSGGDFTPTLGALDSPGAIRIDTATGSIAMTGQGGALGGFLDLDADVIFVGSQQAALDVAAATTLAERNTRLAVNDGAANPAGYIQVGGIFADVGSGIYIQNSGVTNGAPDERAGFTVGAPGTQSDGRDGRGFVIESAFEDDIAVVINGRLANADGSFATGGTALTSLLTQNLNAAEVLTVADLDLEDGSTVNGCIIGGDRCGGIEIDPNVGQTQAILNQLTLLSSQTPDPFQFTFQSPQLISFGDLTPITLAPLIDEPVTGAGNEDFWAGIGYGTESSLDTAVGDRDEKKKQ